MMTLRTNTGMPPGGYQFRDPRVPARVWDDTHSFLEERVKEVIKFRFANPAIYNPATDSDSLNPAKVRIEIMEFNCARIGNNPVYCQDENAAIVERAAPSGRCSCGVALEPRYCPTCSAPRLIGYKCPKCGKNYDL